MPFRAQGRRGVYTDRHRRALVFVRLISLPRIQERLIRTPCPPIAPPPPRRATPPPLTAGPQHERWIPSEEDPDPTPRGRKGPTTGRARPARGHQGRRRRAPLPAPTRGQGHPAPKRLDAAVNIRIEWIAVHLGHRRAGARRGGGTEPWPADASDAPSTSSASAASSGSPRHPSGRRPARAPARAPGSRPGPDPGPGRLAGRPHRRGASPVRRAAGAVPGQVPGVAPRGGQPRPDPRGRGGAGTPARGSVGARRRAGRVVRLDGRVGPSPALAGALKIRELNPAPLRQSDGTRRPAALATFLGARGSDENRPAGRSWPGDPD